MGQYWKLYVYLFDGVIHNCNKCNTPLKKVKLDYFTKKNKKSKLVGYRCFTCRRNYISVGIYKSCSSEGTNENIALSSTDIVHGKQPKNKNPNFTKTPKTKHVEQEIKTISPTSSLIPANGDVVVFKSINNKCKLQHIECVRQIPLKFIQIGSGLSKEMLGFYCTKCKMKFINYSAISDYRELKYIPDFQCKLSYEFGDDLNEVSMLGLYGYNVQKGDLSESQRHSIIDYVIRKKILSPLEVIHILEFNIKFKKKIPSLQDAVRKWDDDIKYVNTIK